MERGQKPKPAHLKLVSGNPGHRPINEAEPQPTGEVKRPAWVKGKAKKLWDKYAPELVKFKVLKSWDVENFGIWCREMAEYIENPKLSNAASRTALVRLGEQFGLTPSGRTRLKTNVKDSDDANPASEFFG